MSPGSPEPLIRRIREMLLRVDDLEDALGEADKLVGLFPDDARSYEARGDVLSGLHMFSDSAEDFAAALEIDPGSAGACKGRGFALAALGRHKEAARMYRRAVQLRPGDPEAAYHLCSELEELGRYGDALAALRAYLPLDEMRNYSVYRHMGRVHGLLGDARKSFENYARSVTLNKPDGDATPFMIKRYREVTRARKKIERLDPSEPGSFYAAGLALLGVKWDDTALDMIKTGARFWPSPSAYLTVADAYASRLDHAQAVECYRRALELPRVPRPVLTACYAGLVKCLFQCGRFVEALECAKKAASLDIAHPDIDRYHTGLLDMGDELADRDQVAGGWTAKHRI